DGWRFTSVCAMPGGGRTETDGTLTGDLQTRYRMEATTTTTGSAIPAMNGTSSVVTEGERQGECPEGWAPGDMEMEGLGRINIHDVQAQAMEAFGDAAPPTD